MNNKKGNLSFSFSFKIDIQIFNEYFLYIWVLRLDFSLETINEN